MKEDEIEVVSFSDGTYGVRKKGFWRYYYLDMVSNGVFWHQISGINFPCCRTDKNTALRKFMLLTDKGTPVKREDL
jgi:hypothetical protein